jgi:hypothetical protein
MDANHVRDQISCALAITVALIISSNISLAMMMGLLPI